MSRLDREISRQVEQQLAQLRTAINDMRQAQTFGGSDIRVYNKGNRDSSGSYTPDISLTNITSSAAQGILVTVTPLASNTVTLPTPLLQLGFFQSSTPGVPSYYSQTSLKPSGGSQQVQLWFKSTGTTITNMDIYISVWSLIPVSYTVARL